MCVATHLRLKCKDQTYALPKEGCACCRGPSPLHVRPGRLHTGKTCDAAVRSLPGYFVPFVLPFQCVLHHPTYHIRPILPIRSLAPIPLFFVVALAIPDRCAGMRARIDDLCESCRTRCPCTHAANTHEAGNTEPHENTATTIHGFWGLCVRACLRLYVCSCVYKCSDVCYCAFTC